MLAIRHRAPMPHIIIAEKYALHSRVSLAAAKALGGRLGALRATGLPPTCLCLDHAQPDSKAQLRVSCRATTVSARRAR